MLAVLAQQTRHVAEAEPLGELLEHFLAFAAACLEVAQPALRVEHEPERIGALGPEVRGAAHEEEDRGRQRDQRGAQADEALDHVIVDREPRRDAASHQADHAGHDADAAQAGA